MYPTGHILFKGAHPFMCVIFHRAVNKYILLKFITVIMVSFCSDNIRCAQISPYTHSVTTNIVSTIKIIIVVYIIV